MHPACTPPYGEAQAIHDALLRRKLRTRNGYEVMTEGDAFIVVFHTAQAALAW